ncbi:MAG: ABC transporter substrate-binding protein, partial [Candidatus Dormibacteraeota bacterium]|nr:ABC transporter substrate-binding protein [Candidatus Dormibacteraeota bacterium]
GSSGSSGSTKQGGTLTVGTGTDADTLDPASQTTTIVGGMVVMVVEPLVQLNQQGKVAPDLATSWSMSSDGTSYTFNLRQNVKFSDGEPLNAAAVKKSLDRINSPQTRAPIPGTLKVIKDVTVVSDSKVQVQLKSPFSPFLGAMTQVTAGIMAPNSFTEHGNSIEHVVWPVGTGPYTYTGRVLGEQLNFSRNPSYWGPHKPAYAKQVYKVVPNAASREALVKSGQAQVIMTPSPNDLPELEKGAGGVKTILAPDDRMIGLNINTQDTRVPQLQNPLVRQALNYAVNKNAIIQKVQFGAAKPLTAPVASSIFGYCNTTSENSYQYNVQKAKQLLQQAGATNLTLTLASPNGHYANDYEDSQAVAADLEAVGIKVTIPNPPTWPTYVSAFQLPPAQMPADLYLLGWAPAYLDASQQDVLFQSSQIPPAGGDNNSGWSSPQTDSLISQATATTDKATAQNDYCQVAKQVWNAAPWVWLYNPQNPIITSTKVKNVYGLPNERVVTAFAQPASA